MRKKNQKKNFKNNKTTTTATMKLAYTLLSR